MLRVTRLGHQHTGWLKSLLALNPCENVYLIALLEVTGTAQMGSPAGSLLGVFDGDQPVAAYWVGGNIIPVAATPGTNQALAQKLNADGRYSCSLIGSREIILDLHSRLNWGRPRGVRDRQPLLAISSDPLIEPDEAVHLVTVEQLPAVFSASVDMFTNEVGFSPIEGGQSSYLARVRNIIRGKNCFARISDTLPQGGPVRRWPATDQAEQVLFKADIGIRAPRIVQVQGVWVHPDVRQQGLGAAGMAAVVAQTRAAGHPTVSLYANDYNEVALRMYTRVGFEQVGTFATIMY
ncbi:GNAT family N-acetyltransferase [Brevibacterium sp. RIT 803]|uniref:GNAT family N-acetyltransferase n=1 Tax=Brevibacterium sp. RIT 803 TaxID=2810210 RepID=UPI00195052C9|nr:GNAT family N-acetyltransferase [Brevibacterium sp. RIT 803]